MRTINEDHMMYGSGDIRHSRHFFVTLSHFLLFDPPHNLKSQDFERMKKSLEISFYNWVPQMT